MFLFGLSSFIYIPISMRLSYKTSLLTESQAFIAAILFHCTHIVSPVSVECIMSNQLIDYVEMNTHDPQQ